MGVVAHLHEGFGNAGQRLVLGGHLLERKGGKGEVAAEDAHRGAVGAIRVGIAAREVDALVGHAVEVGHNIVAAADFRELSAGALQHHQHNVGPLRVEQRVGTDGERVVEAGHDGIAPFGREEFVVNLAAHGAFERRQETEDGVHGSVVQEGILGIVDLPDVGRALLHSTADADEHERHGHQTQHPIAPALFEGLEVGVLPEEGPAQQADEDQEPKQTHHKPHHLHTGGGNGRRGQILEAAGVELIAPVGIEGRVGRKGQGKGSARDHAPKAVGNTERTTCMPNAYNRDEEGHDKEIEGRREVEREAVAQHVAHVGQGKGVSPTVGQHEDQLSSDEQQDTEPIEAEQEEYALFHDFAVYVCKDNDFQQNFRQFAASNSQLSLTRQARPGRRR